MKTKSKRIFAMMLICAMLVLSLAGCKKKDKAVDDEEPTAAEAPATPTPEPVTAKELFEKTGTELKNVVTRTSTNGSEDFKIAIPDGKIDLTGILKMNLELLGCIKMDINMNLSGNVASKGNLGEGDAHIDLSMVTSSMFADGPQTDSDSNDVKFYFDNSTGDEITVYSREGDKDWTKSSKAIKDFVDEYNSMLENYNVNVDQQKVNDLFKNRDQFTEEKTKVTTTADGYTVTSEFTWAEFYNSFKDDLNKLMTEMAGGVAGSLSDSISVNDVVRDLYESGTGNFKMSANFDTEKSLQDISIKVDGFKLSAQIKADEENSVPISFSVDTLDLKFAIDREAGISVTIPEDVKANATEPATGIEDDFNWDITPDDNTPDDNTLDDTTSADGTDKSGEGIGDDVIDATEPITLKQDGVYYMLVGGQTISFPFPAEWEIEMYNYSLDVYPTDDLMASYTDSFVEIAENAISDDLQYVVNYYENERGASDFTVTFVGAAQPSYVFVVNSDDSAYQDVELFQYVPGAKYYLQISILDFTKAADPMDLIQKFGMTF